MRYTTQPLQAAKNWTADKIEKWSARLDYVPNKVVKDTLMNTTQAVIMDTDEPNHSTMKRRIKRIFPFLKCKYVNGVKYSDIIHTT